jgi:hypothetical protein
MIGSGSIKVASSSLARELFTLFDTAQRCSTSLAAGLSNSRPALPEPRLELISLEDDRHSVVDFSNELVCVGYDHRA